MTAPHPSRALHVLSVELPEKGAEELSRDRTALPAALGGLDVDFDRVELVDPTVLAGIGLSGYLTDGHAVDADAILPDEARLDAIRDPVILLLPGALAADSPALYPHAPLTLVGSYPLAQARPAEGTLRTGSAEGVLTGAPPPPAPNARRSSGMVAIVALLVALAVAFVVWLVAA